MVMVWYWDVIEVFKMYFNLGYFCNFLVYLCVSVCVCVCVSVIVMVSDRKKSEGKDIKGYI